MSSDWHDVAGEINVSDVLELRGGKEFLRMWQPAEGGAICVVDPMVIGPDPFLLGMALADCVLHAAKAYSQVANLSEEQALGRIWEGMDAERNHPTSDGVSQMRRKPN